MKKYQIYLFTLFLFIGIGTTQLYGQKNLENWVKKCEKKESIDMTMIVNKDPKSKKETKKMIQIKFKNDESLRKDLVEAFNKDKGNAYKVSMERSGGVTRPGLCSFNMEDYEIRYTFQYNTGRKETIVNVQYLYNTPSYKVRK